MPPFATIFDRGSKLDGVDTASNAILISSPTAPLSRSARASSSMAEKATKSVDASQAATSITLSTAIDNGSDDDMDAAAVAFDIAMQQAESARNSEPVGST